jgi:indolepyruvate ferredoxin oxidoreductase alpha subunit
VKGKLKKARELFEASPFNSYSGPEQPDLLIITSGVCHLYCLEAVESLDLETSVGVLKLGTPWPLPATLVEHHIERTDRVLFVEQVDPFIEDGVRELYADLVSSLGSVSFHGKHSGHISPVGELGPSDVMRALADIMDVALPEPDGDYSQGVSTAVASHMIARPITMCPGCAHRATFWSLKNVLKLVGGDGFTTGDVGCYTMGALPAGYSQLKTIHGMGSGTGLASGFGKLGELGFTQPVVTVCGDSTFFHSVMPALVNAVYNRADFTLLVLDNSGTAMTGFQPHPGIGQTAMGDPVPPVSIEKVCESLGVPVEVIDPFDLEATEEKLIETIEKGGGVRVLILRRKCELIRSREEGARRITISVDPDRCLGMACGCNRLCTRVFSCPGIIWDRDRGRARIDEAICTACGVCVDICPQSAILSEEVSP